MEGYGRMIAYINAWEGGIQNKTVGFAKMERMDGKLWLEIHIKGVYGFSGKCLEVQGIVRKDQETLESLLGNMKIKEGKGDFFYEGNQEKIGDKEVSFFDLCGFFIGTEERKRFFLTYWGQEELNPDWFTSEKETEAPKENQMEKEAALWEERKEESKEENSLKAAQIKEEEPLPEIRENIFQEDFMTPWQILCKRYPKEDLRGEGAKGMEMLRIKPQDIGRLPRENWIYGNNSFLLHSYFQYRYIVLIRKGGEAEQYFLGVPGIYESGEKKMASMFGFYQFLPRQAVEKGACFGYWYTPVNIGNT